MPQAVNTYLDTNNLSEVDQTKREIIELYSDDFRKIDPTGRAGRLFRAIPSELAKTVPAIKYPACLAARYKQREKKSCWKIWKTA